VRIAVGYCKVCTFAFQRDAAAAARAARALAREAPWEALEVTKFRAPTWQYPAGGTLRLAS